MNSEISNKNLISKLKSKNYKAVIQTTTKKLKSNKGTVELFILRGQAYSKIGMHREAASDYIYAKKLGVNNLEIQKFIDVSTYKAHFIDLFKKFVENKIDTKGLFELGEHISIHDPENIELPKTLNSSNLEKLYLKLMKTKGACKPSDLASRIYSSLKKCVEFKKIIHFFSHEENNEAQIHFLSTRLAKNELLINVLKYSICADKDIETFIKLFRRFYFKRKETLDSNSDLKRLFCSIAVQVYLNEYIYDVSEIEKDELALLVNKITEETKKGNSVPEIELIRVAAYSDLGCLTCIKEIQAFANLSEIQKLQFDDKIEELSISKKIPHDTCNQDETSKKVRKQYEEDPYPRWTNLHHPFSPLFLGEIIERQNVALRDRSIFSKKFLSVLVAGCGTGAHPISTSKKLKNVNIDAIDLSLKSLSYAKRKASEFSANNINFFQKDILNLETNSKKYDYIESFGVLHHMENPSLGIHILKESLFPGGILFVALYSSIGRRSLRPIHEFIRENNIKPNDDGVKYLRELIKVLPTKNQDEIPLWQFSDFYSKSNLRDLLFHEKETSFNLSEISKMLEENKLAFCGFHLTPGQVFEITGSYNMSINNLNLEKWVNIETLKPNLFSGMYQFYCQSVD